MLQSLLKKRGCWMHWLIAPHILFGLKAPWFAWVAALGLLLTCLYAMVRFAFQLLTITRAESEVIRRLAILQEPPVGSGMSTTDIEALATTFESSGCLGHLWNRLRAQVVRRRTQDGDRFWLMTPVREIITVDSVCNSRINRDFYQALPGILTGTGLMFTFLAILVALLDVRIENNQVTGLALLIEGLSGKFVSSIAALAAATIFILFEKQQLHRLSLRTTRLADSLDRVVCTLTEIQLLAELQQDMAEQSIAFRSFNADLSGRLKQSFSESMGPTLVRMVETIDELNRLMRAAESEKTESITQSLQSLLSRLESSITGSLGDMSKQFSSSLSGATMMQFDQLSKSLAGAAGILESMNVQNQTTQAGLAELVQIAKTSTAEQMALGKSQVEDLTSVLKSVLSQIEQTTGASVTQMGSTIAAVVADLSNKVKELAEHSRVTMLQNSQTSTDAARTVLKEASDWTHTSKEQLADLLNRLTSQLATADNLRSALDGAVGRFSASGVQFAVILEKIRESCE